MKIEDMLKKTCRKVGAPYLSPCPDATPAEDQARIMLLHQRIADERGKMLCSAKLSDRLHKKRLVRQIIRNKITPGTAQSLLDFQQRVRARTLIGGGHPTPYMNLPAVTTLSHQSNRFKFNPSTITGLDTNNLLAHRNATHDLRATHLGHEVHPCMTREPYQEAAMTLLGNIINTRHVNNELLCTRPPVSRFSTAAEYAKAATFTRSHGPLKKRLSVNTNATYDVTKKAS